jgi:hypothetical protein
VRQAAVTLWSVQMQMNCNAAYSLTFAIYAKQQRFAVEMPDDRKRPSTALSSRRANSFCADLLFPQSKLPN